MDRFDSNYIVDSVNTVHKRISDHILKTPLLHSKWLSAVTGCEVFLKMESEQITGSFKLRGAASKILKLNERYEKGEEKKPIITASSGNHGLASALMTSKLNIPLTVYVYESLPKVKEECLRRYENIQLVKKGHDCGQAEEFARAYAKEAKIEYISSYNDYEVMFGQATVALEMLDQNKDLDAVFVPVGGGGLIGGIGAYIKSVNPSIQVIACQPIADCCMYKSIQAGKIVEYPEETHSFADAVGGSIDLNSITFDFCNKFVDEWLLLSEDEIEKAVFDILNKEKKMVEGVAGLVIAGLQKLQERFKGKNVALVMCGGAIGTDRLKYLLDKFC